MSRSVLLLLFSSAVAACGCADPSSFPCPDSELPARLSSPARDSGPFYRWSVAALIAGNVADGASSYGMQERNPLLGSSVDGRAIAIKGALLGGDLLLQRVILRHRPDWRRRLAWLNLAGAGGFGVVAVHNMGVR